MLAALVLAAASAATMPDPCAWTHPGANPYRGDPADALADFPLPEAARRRLAQRMRAHRFTDVATITRSAITGREAYDDLRGMHSGGGVVCRGAVDRSGWADDHVERGLVYCDDEDACVIVPTVCNNVSLVTRRRPPVPDDRSAIDIAPAAGVASPPGAADVPGPDAGPATPGGSPDAAPPDCCTAAPALPGPGGMPSPAPADLFPIGVPHGGGAPPPAAPPISPVPELPPWAAWLAGLAGLRGGHRACRLRVTADGRVAHSARLSSQSTQEHAPCVNSPRSSRSPAPPPA
jgi:hypothetical protein